MNKKMAMLAIAIASCPLIAAANDPSGPSQSFPARGLTTVGIGIQRGTIRLNAAQGDLVTVTVKKLDNAGRCDIVLERRDDAVVAIATTTGDINGSGSLDEGGGDESVLGRIQIPKSEAEACSVAVDVSAPAGLAADIAASYAKVRIEDRAGKVDVSTSRSAVQLSKVSGPLKISANDSAISGDVDSASSELSLVGGTTRLDWKTAPRSTAINLSSVKSEVSLTLPRSAKVGVESDSLLAGLDNQFEALTADASADVSVKISAVGGKIAVRKEP